MLPLAPRVSRPGLWPPGDKEAWEAFECLSVWVVWAVAERMDGRRRPWGQKPRALGVKERGTHNCCP